MSTIDSQNIPWKRLAAEGAVVVVSILLAFGIDAWWDGYIESKREHKQLVAARDEFSESLLGLDEVLESIQSHADGVDELISLLKDAESEPVEVPGPLLGYAIGWRTSDVSTSTLDALIASGELNLVKNDELRRKLAGFPAFLLNVTEDEVMAMSFAESVMSSFLAREGLAEAAYANRPGLGRPGAPESATITPSAEFVGLLMARRVHFEFALGGLPAIKTYLEDLIRQIDAEMASASDNLVSGE
jgi:hypothetical protein